MINPNSPPGAAADTLPIIVAPDNYWISVQIDPAFSALLNTDHLHALATHTLLAEGRRDPLEVGITITDDKEIHTLNKQYLDHDYPTDVLSFGADAAVAEGDSAPAAGADTARPPVPATDYVTEGYEGDEEESGAEQPLPGDDAAPQPPTATPVAFVTPPDWPTYLGDVVISYETAAAQAGDYSHSPAAEVDVLLVHGLLHLLGYDDQTPQAHDQMHARQDAIVLSFKC
ncbi:MAG: rRNA maturation RNase YbeY [Chloroflexota bacterium]|nr:rRNA maturation RNase YbeY [Chloroflexota bacterium]